MILITELVRHLEVLLKPALYQDYCPNGLQVAPAKDKIKRIASGVSANQALIEAAVSFNADLLLVHHGFFWKGENPCLIGIHYQRVARLIREGIGLVSYHLPLDGHETLGNNVQLAKKIGIELRGEFEVAAGPGIGRLGQLKTEQSGKQLAEQIAVKLQRPPFYIPGNKNLIRSVAWCTGAAQDFIFSAAAAQVDAFITGEVSERTVAFAKELGLHFYAAGHHATERYGVRALGEYLQNTFNLEHQFIDIDNPV